VSYKYKKYEVIVMEVIRKKPNVEVIIDRLKPKININSTNPNIPFNITGEYSFVLGDIMVYLNWKLAVDWLSYLLLRDTTYMITNKSVVKEFRGSGKEITLTINQTLIGNSEVLADLLVEIFDQFLARMRVVLPI
jgi:hypothetical protein